MWTSSVLLLFFFFFSSARAQTSSPSSSSVEIPCPDFHPKLTYPCRCGLNDVNATRINCDGAVFAEFPVLPYRFYIQEFSQRDAGIQTLGAQLFTASDLPLVRVDFSHNQIRRLTERLFDGVEDTIEVIELGHNLLGDNLNPVFSSGEFQHLQFLRMLDLSYNKLTEIEEGLLEGCENLKVRIGIGIKRVQEMSVFVFSWNCFCSRQNAAYDLHAVKCKNRTNPGGGGDFNSLVSQFLRRRNNPVFAFCQSCSTLS